VTTLAGRLAGLHATDPASVFLAARARLDGTPVDAIEDALYGARSLVRILGMRRTMFVVPALSAKIAVAQDKSYGAVQGVSTKVLFLLAADGRIVRGRPLGSWTSTLYRWAPLDAWLPGGIVELETAARAVLAEAQRLQEWVGDARVTPRFRTPLERELCS